MNCKQSDNSYIYLVNSEIRHKIDSFEKLKSDFLDLFNLNKPNYKTLEIAYLDEDKDKVFITNNKEYQKFINENEKETFIPFLLNINKIEEEKNKSNVNKKI